MADTIGRIGSECEAKAPRDNLMIYLLSLVFIRPGNESHARLSARRKLGVSAMNHRSLRYRLFAAGTVLAAMLAAPSVAQEPPADLTVMPPVSTDFQPGKTAWGDPDFRGTSPIKDVAEMPVNRPEQYGNRFWKTDEELATEQARVEQLE